MNEEIKGAAEIAKDPSTYPLATYVWVLLLSMWGGFVRVLREVRLGNKNAKEIALVFIAELSVSGFSGCLTFFLLEPSGLRIGYIAVMTGIAGYMGGRAIDVFETLYRKQIGKGDGQ